MKKHSGKNQIFNLFILDESGSMESIASSMVSSFNELVQTISGEERADPSVQQHISLVTFNGNGHTVRFWNSTASQVPLLSRNQYRPDASTPLYDTMGRYLNQLARELSGRDDFHVVVTLLTDGMENASVEYTGNAISSLVKELENSGKYTFTYIGTDHDVHAAAQNIQITNVMVFGKSSIGLQDMVSNEKQARSRFYKRLKDGDTNKKGYYEED